MASADAPDRKIYLYISPTVRYRQGQVLIAMPSGADVKDFLWDSGWLEIADHRRMSLLVAEAGPGGWKADETEYMEKAYAFMNTKTYLHTENAAFYLVGYGDAANAAMALAVAYQSIWSGVGAFGVDNFDPSFLEKGNTQAPNRFNTDAPNVLLKDLPVPMWIGAASKTARVNQLIGYWKKANNAYIKASPNNWAGEIWEPPNYLDEFWNINEVAVSRVLVTLGGEDLTYNRDFTNYLWYSFLETQRREDVLKHLVFRPFKHNDDFMDHYTVRASDNVSANSLREYWVYESDLAKGAQNGTVPLVIVMHGMNQSGADMPHFSGWHLVTDANKLITAYPSGSRSTGKKATLSPSTTNDMDYFDKMLEKILADYPSVDPGRVYVSGHSMGCNFTTTAAVLRPMKIAAVASASMGPAGNVSGGDRSVPMPIMISVGQFDTAGGGGIQDMATPHNKSTFDTYWFPQNGVTDMDADAAKRYEGQGKQGSLFGWTFKNVATGFPVAKIQWVKSRGHGVLPEEAFSLYDFLKNYSRAPNGDSYYQGTKIE
jgi:poly(3-hydroxybutyrate) depolymerase